MKTYVNGEVVATFNRSGEIWASDKSLSFGVRGDTKDVHWMEGVFSDAAIFDEALTEEEIQDIMNNGLQVAVLAVSEAGKLTTTWGAIKSH